MGPLDWSGPAFLALFASAMAIAIVVSVVATRMIAAGSAMAGANGVPDRRRPLPPSHVALLCGGPGRAIQAALVALLSRGAVKWSATGTLEAGPTSERPDDALERAVLHATSTGAPSLRDLRTPAEPAIARITERLVHDGLLVPDANRRTMGSIILVLMGAVAALGAAKVAVGVSRDRPVVFLVLLLFATLVVTGVLMARRPRRTPAGEAFVDRCRDEHFAAAVASTRPQASADAPAGIPMGLAAGASLATLPLAVALLGPSALAGTELAAEQQRLQTLTPGAGSDGWSSGSSCSSGGDSGGGDSGGGGCGGCGGGGGD